MDFYYNFDLIFFFLLLFFIIIGTIIRFIQGLINKNKAHQINFDEFDDIEKIKQQDINSKEEMEYESEVLSQVYRDTYNDAMFNLTLELLDEKNRTIFPDINSNSELFETDNQSKIDIEKIKRDLYNFKIIDNVEIEEDIVKEGVPINALKENGHNFDVKLFKKWSRQIFGCIKSGSEEELNIVKNFISEELYDKLEYQRKQFAKDGLEFVTKDLLIEKCYLYDYSRSMSKEQIKILINATMIEYIINKATNEIVRGNNEKAFNKNIVMTFTREDTTDDEGFLHNCPNCGAEVVKTEFGKCRYCNTLVMPIRYNWTLTKFETI